MKRVQSTAPRTTAVTRRGFLRTAVGAGAAAGATAGSASGQQQTTVDMTDSLVFDPDEVTVAPGETVRWVNVGNIGHSVTAYEDQIPEEAEFFASGGFNSESAARNGYPEGDIPGGEAYSYTFDVEGTYDYFCIPHEGVGMVGTVEVSTGGGGEDGAAIPSLPESALTLGVAVTVAFLSVLGAAYLFIKYGGDYGPTAEDEESG
ncbi:plastocyanin/azurin family copper-binding protein [Haloarchaeobius sp. HRN-SO-5]|uniref:plastocyanin/azurin family copper-binding protein n=1 Tax=Haloarchaeobius sp. HRN-SO-5 TaxID=3446118 RepID=UPI003EBD6FE2